MLVLTDENSTGTLPSVPADASSGDDEGSGGSCAESGATYAAENMSASTGAAAGEGWNLWSNGSLTVNHTFGDQSSVISVRASGQFAGGAWPHLVVSIDGEPIGEALVDSASYEVYEFIESGAGSRQLGVAFDNDYFQNGEDRNLFVDTVSIAPICQ